MLKAQSLGHVASAANGILITSGTNATPIVATITAGHRLKNNDRIIISGVTTLTAMNGEWSLGSVGATTATLLGSSGNGAFGGTASVGVIMDTTPFMKGHEAVAYVGNSSGSAVLVGTVIVESSDDHVTYADASMSGRAAIPAATAGLNEFQPILLKKYMRFRCSAYTSGGANCAVVAGL